MVYMQTPSHLMGIRWALKNPDTKHSVIKLEKILWTARKKKKN